MRIKVEEKEQYGTSDSSGGSRTSIGNRVKAENNSHTNKLIQKHLRDEKR